ncbi:NAD-dependent epimerase/dehydratase family protein [Methylobacterium soli]|uniref:NAD(P)-dependent oxidoreductase n=1 Tax=Methylobacterium soli TaxID=553447 RepID=A0A6L3SR75_9HYPH|nr:NAD(P)-dependent oxidoreductase [Methylobacterium soli]KAB1072919.1 NAD(P)-dependent oxidoreductase [Methylobacterium soli]GJE46511.1 hypothetical protein AEGHOMDF_5717 [Methylobacterium soli]
MNKRLFLAGATGAMGRSLAPLLVASGWLVVGTTRSMDKVPSLTAMGVEPVVVDAFDSDQLTDAVRRFRPSVVVHQLTDLPPALDPSRMAEALVRTARLREEGTRNLIAAARSAGSERFVAQSIAFAYAPGPTPHAEADQLDVDAEGGAGVTARGVTSLERQVLEAPMTGVILRYGALYGPGTGFDRPTFPGAVHIDAAAKATELAVSRTVAGVFNIAEEDGFVSSDRARRLLDWKPEWRREHGLLSV